MRLKPCCRWECKGGVLVWSVGLISELLCCVVAGRVCGGDVVDGVQ